MPRQSGRDGRHVALAPHVRPDLRHRSLASERGRLSVRHRQQLRRPPRPRHARRAPSADGAVRRRLGGPRPERCAQAMLHASGNLGPRARPQPDDTMRPARRATCDDHGIWRDDVVPTTAAIAVPTVQGAGSAMSESPPYHPGTTFGRLPRMSWHTRITSATWQEGQQALRASRGPCGWGVRLCPRGGRPHFTKPAAGPGLGARGRGHA